MESGSLSSFTKARSGARSSRPSLVEMTPGDVDVFSASNVIESWTSGSKPARTNGPWTTLPQYVSPGLVE